ncbi:hypothetical protein ACFVYE_32720 [Streptomyces sp. NPDC058239]|uniref:hypothetical protein n=1 Tax=Streptomyces sp. NPDC058239 TaxID=3346395 RepID=UPI0036E0C016
MSTSKSEPPEVTAVGGDLQPPPEHLAPPEPTAAEARDRLLAAIGREAGHVADTHAGRASVALGELAHAYRNLLTGTSQADVALLVVPADAGGFEGAFTRNTAAPAEIPAATTEARDALLRAIGREVEHVAATQPGQASAPLAELTRAYALVTTGSTAAAQARHSISLVAHVPTNGFYVVPVDPDLVNKDQYMSFSPTTGATR